MTAFESRRSYNLVQHRLSFQAPPSDPVICDYWRKPPIAARRRSDWVSGSTPTNQNGRNWVTVDSPNQNGRNRCSMDITNQNHQNWISGDIANQNRLSLDLTNQSSQNWDTGSDLNSRNCVKLANNKVKVKVADEVHTVTLRRKKVREEPKEEEIIQEPKRSPIQDIFKRLSWHHRKKKVDKDVGRRRPRKSFSL